MNMPENKKQKIVIIGGVAAGPKICAKLLRTQDFDCQIDLYTEEDIISYSACGLPYYIEGLIEDVNRLIVRTPQQFEEKGAYIHLNKRCTKILPQEHKIVIADTKTGIIQEVEYDKLAITTGARPIVPPIQNLHLKNIFTLRKIKDGVNIRNKIREENTKKAVIVGGGYIGIEILEAFYKNGLEDVINTFTQFITGLKDNSKVLINIDDFGNNELIKKNPTYRNFISYATKDNSAKYVAKNIKLDTLSSSFDIYNSGKLLGQIELSIPGEHNVANALGVCALLIEAGIEFSLFAPYFREFTGMGRRFQKSAQIGTITVIDDYAHHPAEIKATLEAVKNYDKGRVFAIFQPHRYSRFQSLYDDFLNSFDNADFVAVLDVYAAGEKYTGAKTSMNFADNLSKLGKNVKYYTGTIDEAASEIVKELRENDLVFTLGAGDITKMGGVLNDLYLLKK